MNDINYLGDDAWNNFEKLFAQQWDKFERKEKILNLVNGDKMIAMVVSQVSNKPEDWLTKKIPALKGKTPLWCLNNNNKNKLKSILMNMPW